MQCSVQIYTTLALPIIANLKQLKFDCPHDELIAVTFEADKEMSFFTDLIEINSVFMTFKMFFATQRPTLRYLALTGDMLLGGNLFVTTVDLSSDFIWYIEATTSGNVDVIKIAEEAFSREVPSSTLGSITISEVSLQGSIDVVNGYRLVLAFQGTAQISNWFSDDMYIIASHSLSKVGITDPELFLFTGCDSAYTVNLDELLSRISADSTSSVAFFSSLVLSNFHISYANPSFSIPDSTLRPLGVPTKCLVPHESSGFKYLFNFIISSTPHQWVFTYNEGIISFKPSLLSASLNDMFSLISSNTLAPSTVSVLSKQDVSDLAVLSMDLDINSKLCNLTVMPTDEVIVVLRGTIGVSEIEVAFQLKLENNEVASNSFFLLGRFTFLGLHFSVQITTEDGSTYKMSACSAFYQGGLSGILVALNPAFAVLPLMDAIGLLKVGLLSPCIEATFQPNTYPAS